MKKIQKLQYRPCRESRHAWTVIEWCEEYNQWESVSDSTDLYNAKRTLIPNMNRVRLNYWNCLPSAWIKINRIGNLTDFEWHKTGSLLAARAHHGITDEQAILISDEINVQLENNPIDWEQDENRIKHQIIMLLRKSERVIGL